MLRALLLLVLGASRLLAHDLWVDVQPGQPPPTGEVTVVVAVGHYFPASEMVLQDRLVRSLHVVRPDGRREDVATAPQGRQREGRLKLDGMGWHVVSLVVQKPQLDHPDYWARALVVPEGAAAQAYPAAGTGLEIVPVGDVSAFQTGQELSVEARRDGRAVDGKIQVVAEAGGTDWLTVHPGQPAKLSLRKPGRYLLIHTQGGQSCSLTFHVKAP